MNFFAAFRSLSKRLLQGMLDPVRDWMAMLTFSAIALVGIIIWNVWAFDRVANGGIIGAAATTTTSAFNKASLDAIRATFADRAEERMKYETGTYRFADPSL